MLTGVAPLHGAGYGLYPEFHSHDHSACPEALQDLFCMCDKVHGARSQESGKAQPDWSCAYKAKAGILQNKTVWANAANIPPEAWYEMYVKPWHPELARVGMRRGASFGSRREARGARRGSAPRPGLDGPAHVPLVAAWRFLTKTEATEVGPKPARPGTDQTQAESLARGFAYCAEEFWLASVAFAGGEVAMAVPVEGVDVADVGKQQHTSCRNVTDR